MVDNNYIQACIKDLVMQFYWNLPVLLNIYVTLAVGNLILMGVETGDLVITFSAALPMNNKGLLGFAMIACVFLF